MAEGTSYTGWVQIQQQLYGRFCRLCREPLSSDKYNLYRVWSFTKADTLLSNITGEDLSLEAECAPQICKTCYRRLDTIAKQEDDIQRKRQLLSWAKEEVSSSRIAGRRLLRKANVVMLQARQRKRNGLPNCSVLKTAFMRRMVKFHIRCNFDILTTFILAKSPFAVLLVGTNPFLYGSALLAIVLAASLLLLLTATLFTIGQVFLEDPEFRLTRREAVRQAGWLLLVATGCVAVALFLGCICFLLLLSKDGNKVQSVSGVASFFMRHVVLTALPLLMNSLIRFIRKIRV